MDVSIKNVPSISLWQKTAHAQNVHGHCGISNLTEAAGQVQPINGKDLEVCLPANLMNSEKESEL